MIILNLKMLNISDILDSVIEGEFVDNGNEK